MCAFYIVDIIIYSYAFELQIYMAATQRKHIHVVAHIILSTFASLTRLEAKF